MKFNVGIELGEQYIKLVVSDLRGVYPRICDCMVSEIAGMTNAAIADIISSFLKNQKYLPVKISLCLSRNYVTVRNFLFPSNDPQEIAKMVELHSGRIVPYKSDEMFCNHYINGFDEAGYARVVVAIVARKVMQKQTRIIERAGFFVDNVMLSSMGISALALKKLKVSVNKNEAYLFLDIDTTFTDLTITLGDKVVFSCNISFNVDTLSDVPGQTRLLGEIRQALLIFNDKDQIPKPEKVFVGGVFKEEIAKIIERELELTAAVVELSDIDKCLKSKKRAIPTNISLSAVRSLLLPKISEVANFSLPEIEIKKELNQQLKRVMVLGLGIVYIIGVSFFILLGRQNYKKLYLNKLNQQISIIEKDLGVVINHIDDMKQVRSLLSQRQLPEFVLLQLREIIGEAVAITNLIADENNTIVLKGKAQKLSDIFELSTSLEKIKVFEDVQTRDTRKKDVKGQEVVEFEIRFKIDKSSFTQGNA